MYELFVFSMYITLYTFIFTISLSVFYFCVGIILVYLKHSSRLRITRKNHDLFGDLEIVTPKMRIEMAYIMEERARKNLEHLKVFEKHVNDNYYEPNRLRVHGKK